MTASEARLLACSVRAWTSPHCVRSCGAVVRTGKMLLDEKEADAEAHEGEKEALWRRIQVRVLDVFFYFLKQQKVKDDHVSLKTTDLSLIHI